MPYDPYATTTTWIGNHVTERRQLARRKALTPDAVAAYASLYHDAFRQRQMVYFLHVSKTGGTYFCNCGLYNGCDTLGDYRSNCHGSKKIGPFNYPVWWKDSDAMSLRRFRTRPRKEYLECSKISQWYKRRNQTFAGNEAYLVPEEHICPAFWNVLIVRDPVQRLVSHLIYINEVRDLMRADGLDSLNARFGLFADNYYIRSLLGQQVYELPLGGVTRAHLEEAKRVLERMDLVIVLNGSRSFSQKMNLTLGWAGCEHAPHAVERSRGTVSALLRRSAWRKSEWSRLYSQNRLDMELYKYAGALEELDWRVFGQPAFWRHRPHCKRGTCGFLCK